jgi:competence protein ComEA
VRLAKQCLRAWLLSALALAVVAAQSRIDINTASEKDLEQLSGVGAATAKKIIAGRPYSSVDDLKRAGISQRTIDQIRSSVTVSGSAPAARVAAPSAASKTAGGGAVDLNTASEKDLEQLSGVGPSSAKKIIAGRPYSSVDDLKRAGVSQRTIDQIRSNVTVSGSARAAAPSKAPTSKTAGGGAVDLNTASEKDLEQLSGVGPATAKKIIAGRPYSSVDDLKRAGVSQRTIDQIRPNVIASGYATQSASGARATSRPSPRTDEPDATIPPRPSPAGARTSPPAAPPAPATRTTAAAPTPPAAQAPVTAPTEPGMVWVNTDTKIFHREGDPWYGKTKHGKYMREADALQAGYRESKSK